MSVCPFDCSNRFLLAGSQKTFLMLSLATGVYVANVFDANILAGTRDAAKVSGRAFNVACGKRTTLFELASLIERAAGRSVERSFAEPRAGDIKESLAAISRAREALGYEPKVEVLAGLQLVVDHMRSVSA